MGDKDMERQVRYLQGLFVGFHGEPKCWRGGDGASGWPAWSEVFARCEAEVMAAVIREDLGAGYGVPSLSRLVEAYGDRMRGRMRPAVARVDMTDEDRRRVAELIGKAVG